MTIDIFLPIGVSLICGFVIPQLTELVTKWDAPPALKSWIASILSAIAGALTTVVWDPSIGWAGYVTAIGAAFVATFSTHHSRATKPLKRKTAHIGVGGAHKRTHYSNQMKNERPSE